MTLREKVEYLTAKRGFRTSYAENMLCAIGEAENGDAAYIVGESCVTCVQKIPFNALDNILIWNIEHLLGEYVLALSGNDFSFCIEILAQVNFRENQTIERSETYETEQNGFLKIVAEINKGRATEFVPLLESGICDCRETCDLSVGVENAKRCQYKTK